MQKGVIYLDDGARGSRIVSKQIVGGKSSERVGVRSGGGGKKKNSKVYGRGLNLSERHSNLVPEKVHPHTEKGHSCENKKSQSLFDIRRSDKEGGVDNWSFTTNLRTYSQTRQEVGGEKKMVSQPSDLRSKGSAGTHRGGGYPARGKGGPHHRGELVGREGVSIR